MVTVKPGEQLNVNLSVDDPNDRVRVMYVPTPFDVADGMVKLAGITANDVAFEPGCGDARVTIAAVKGGAKKAVGIDIDQERVEESRTRVKEAGLADRIEIRLGDALDIKDLSTASVVFLYMGDHFNMLIRPILWRDLKVGARVVSHRFLMGDWKPDKTVTMSSELGGEYRAAPLDGDRGAQAKGDGIGRYRVQVVPPSAVVNVRPSAAVTVATRALPARTPTRSVASGKTTRVKRSPSIVR